MTIFNMFLSIEVGGYAVESEAEVLVAIEALLRKHHVWADFLDGGMQLPLMHGRQLMAGGRMIKAGTERPVIVANPSGWSLRQELRPALTEQFGNNLQAQFELVDDGMLEPDERLVYYVEHGLCFNVEAARPEAHTHVSALLKAYFRLRSWQERGEMWHLLSDEPNTVILPVLRDLIQSPFDSSESDLFFGQMQTVLHFGATSLSRADLLADPEQVSVALSALRQSTL